MTARTLGWMAVSLFALGLALPAIAASQDVPRTAMDAFLREYWIADQKVFHKLVDGPSRPVAEPGKGLPFPIGSVVEAGADLWRDAGDVVSDGREALSRLTKTPAMQHLADFWWVPHLWETVMDAYELTKDPRYRILIRSIHDGFRAHYSIERNVFNDDLDWLALATARAYEVTGDRMYLQEAEKLQASIARFESPQFGGGITWKRDGSTFKCVPINGPFVILSMKLYRATKDPKYLVVAKRIYTWIVDTLYHDGEVYDGINVGGLHKESYSYNYGTFIGASLALFEQTSEPTYKARADEAADWAISTLSADGIIKPAGHGDGSGFNMIFFRYLVELARFDGEGARLSFLRSNAESAWVHRRKADNIMGYDWSRPTPVEPIESFAAATGVAIQMQSRLAAGQGR